MAALGAIEAAAAPGCGSVGRDEETRVIGVARRILGGALAGMTFGLVASPAGAAVRTGSETFNPNATGPTFGNPAQLPLITITVSYDDQAGTIVLSESGADPSYIDGFESKWANFGGISVSGVNTSEADISGYGAAFGNSPSLTDNEISGSLTSQTTVSADGSTVTAVWSDPALANQNFTYVSITPSDESADPTLSGSFYFSAYGPSVVVTNPGPQSTVVGTPLGTQGCGTTLGPCCGGSPCPGVQVGATEINLAAKDPTSSFPDVSESATGLPPGLSINAGGYISGTPTSTGSFTTTVIGSAGFNNGTQATAGSTTFSWQITAAPPPPPPPVRLDSRNASRAFRDLVPKGAYVPSSEGLACPEIYQDHGRYSLCFAEYRLGSAWHLISGTTRIKANVPTGHVTGRGSWTRRWVKCNLHAWNSAAGTSASRILGTLTSNNNCGREAPQSDFYLVGQELDPTFLVQHPRARVSTVGWIFVQSAGFGSLGTYYCPKSSGTYQCTNRVGDSFRYHL